MTWLQQRPSSQVCDRSVAACCGQRRRHMLQIKCEWSADTPWESEEEKAFCERTFTQEDVFSILNTISDDDARSLGFKPEMTHPRDMMIKVLLVPPPVKLQDILRRSNDLKSVWQDNGYPPAAGVRSAVPPTADATVDARPAHSPTPLGGSWQVRRGGPA